MMIDMIVMMIDMMMIDNYIDKSLQNDSFLLQKWLLNVDMGPAIS